MQNKTALKEQLLLVDPKNIEVEKKFNPRKKFSKIPELAKSLVEVGLFEPLQGFKDKTKFILTDGHRRFKAIEHAMEQHKSGNPDFLDISKISKVKFITGTNDYKERMFMVITTGEGKEPLDPMEKLEAFNNIIAEYEKLEVKKTDIVKKISESTGMSTAGIYNILKLQTIPVEVKAALKNEEISENTVSHIVRAVTGKNKAEKAAIKNSDSPVAEKKIAKITKKENEEIKKIVDKTVKNSKKEAKKEGKDKQKATIAHINGLIPGQTMSQRIDQVLEELHVQHIATDKAVFFRMVLNKIENKMPMKDIIKTFKD